jgi:hypothetical protein
MKIGAKDTPAVGMQPPTQPRRIAGLGGKKSEVIFL